MALIVQESQKHQARESNSVEKPADRHMLSVQYALSVLQNEEFSKYVREVYLYGSYARGQQKYWSDVDLLIRVVANTPPKIMRKMRTEVIPEDINLPEVDLKFTMGEEYSTSYRFNENIKRDGRLIWKKG